MPARKGPGPGEVLSEPPAAGLVEKGDMSAVPESVGSFTHYVLGKKDAMCLERIDIDYR